MSYWIASYPKSGNTWVRLFVEAYVFGQCNINKLRATTGDQQRQFYHQIAACDLSQLGHLEILAIREAALSSMQRLSHPFLIKTHHQNVIFHERALIPKWFSDGAVYVMRDPRDLVISMAHYMNNMDVDSAIGKLFTSLWLLQFRDEPNFYHFVGDWRAHVDSWINAEFPVLVMRYEDMVSNPYAEFKRLIDFHPCLEFDHDRLTRALELVQFEKLQAQEKAEGFKESKGKGDFFRLGTYGQWEQLTNEQLERLAPLVEYYEEKKAA